MVLGGGNHDLRSVDVGGRMWMDGKPGHSTLYSTYYMGLLTSPARGIQQNTLAVYRGKLEYF